MKEQYSGREVFDYINKIGRVLNDSGLEKKWAVIGGTAVVAYLYHVHGDEAFEMWERGTDDVDIVAGDFGARKVIESVTGVEGERSNHIPYKYAIKGDIKIDLYLPTRDGRKIMIENNEISPEFFERAKKIENVYVPDIDDLISMKESVKTGIGGPREEDEYDIKLLREKI